ncbi:MULTISPECIES: 4-hydroxy-2-oxovalerate aldolase [Parasphingorhabdus]|jgi:4-hydroxy-2-oxovalerate/4-hydroxy-2-oxohexanoate aldolase|uniref:4-hydroxy-2-oxovalerate aldolase n=1 Tax=Parasphingorhabdus flavimaris TaxID=266812 RepID=A0ABX2N0J3_9SPHN|nr:4-hydroxy-2-oxovalerate aldolase [Parasphingorhabdus flavimaris]NVD27232.1 4-hydroxy-2-oxovalerate aldolase [Parasphingorhabdus flavimaris]|tara:strand:+ start:35 stop:1075 length:1041 start_codon:yes stop_codon:yes gene_type:complete
MTLDDQVRGRKLKLHDMCLRDGMHSMRHQITLDQMVDIASGLDDAGVPLIQVTHGDGLGGSSLNYGRGLHTDREYISAVAKVVKNATISVLHVPGIGTLDELRMAADCGAGCVHVASHCTEANVTEQHIGLGRELGLDTVGFLMMAHMTSIDHLFEQALLMEGYGATTIYCVDSAGYMLPDDVTARIGGLRTALKDATEIGFHAHHNLGMGVANSLAAVAAGADRIDGSAAGLGAGAGNTPLELMAAVSERMGIKTGVDLFKLMDVAEDRVLPIMPQPPRADRDSITLGFAGVYSTFLYQAKEAERKYGLSARDILIELARKKMIGGQEDMIEDTALSMAKERDLV